MQKFCLFVLSVILLQTFAQSNHAMDKKSFYIWADDGLQITADLYAVAVPKDFILLFHQARFSRGEYLPIIPKLNEMGYSCLSIDQRSGDQVNEIINETHQLALDLGKPTEYKDAIADIDATIQYVIDSLKIESFIYWGSSYSAALSFYFGQKYPDAIKAIVAFSPGEYFDIHGESISSLAAKTDCPVFISSAKNEEHNWRAIYTALKEEKYFYLPTDEGFHGSRALWPEKAGNQAVWSQLSKYLEKLPK
jgi:pimeloyl-ACP methyl ester carboxylesterase